MSNMLITNLVDESNLDFDDLNKYLPAIAEAQHGAITITVDGYGNCAGTQVVAIERYEGILRLIVWADNDTEEPTHTISLEGAKI